MSELISVGVCTIIAVFGMIVHWGKKYAKEETNANFIEYFFRVDKKHSVVAFTTLLGVIAGMFTVGTPYDISTMTAAQFATFFMAGYTIDSVVNKAEEI